MGPVVPFRLLVTACPSRNVFFKTRLSSNAGYYNNKRTSSAFWEDASTAALDDSRGRHGCEPPGQKNYCKAGDRGCANQSEILLLTN